MNMHVDVNEPSVSALDAAWRELCGDLAAASELVTATDVAKEPALRADGYRYLLNLLNAGLEQKVFSANPDYPEIGRHQDHTRRYSNECADCLFGHTALDPRGTYRLAGTGGSPRFIGLTLYENMDFYEQLDRDAPSDFKATFAAATGSTCVAMSHPGGLQLDANGGFDVTISAEPHSGNWLPMDSRVRYLVTRQYFYDWDREEPHHISIERLDPPDGGPVTDPATVRSQVVDLGRYVKGFAAYWEHLHAHKRDAKRNVLRTEPPVQDSYAGDGSYLSYGGGFLEIEPDQAVIIEVAPPECHFWNFQLGDYWGQTLDYIFRQTSLNGHQASLDDDGVFRAVVCQEDPGVPNWLDTAGHRFLNVVYRWWQTASPDLPDPAVRFVPFQELRNHLPGSTPSTNADERREMLDGRRRAVQRRYRR